MTEKTEGGEVALWYLRYGRMDYDIWDSEAEAAGIAVAMTDDCNGVPIGLQFPDGRLVDVENQPWPAYEEAARRRDEFAASARKQEPPPQRKITAPFGGGEIEIDASEPDWLGLTP